MPIRGVLVTGGADDAQRLRFEDEDETYEFEELLSDEEENIAVRMDEIVRSISRSVSQSVVAESELMVEITGSISLRADGEAKWVLFRVGGGATATGAVKVVLKTKVAPAKTEP
jgi:hypothetical protein